MEGSARRPIRCETGRGFKGEVVVEGGGKMCFGREVQMSQLFVSMAFGL